MARPNEFLFPGSHEVEKRFSKGDVKDTVGFEGAPEANTRGPPPDPTPRTATGARYPKRTLTLGYSVKLSCYPGRLLAVALHDVEVAEDGEADLHEELEAEEGEDGEVDIGQLLRERPALLQHRHRGPGAPRRGDQSLRRARPSLGTPLDSWARQGERQLLTTASSHYL